jgi:hypothetical protein
MPILRKLVIVAALITWTCAAAYTQDLAPRAYVITPLHSNALTLTSTYYTGGLQFDGAVPITGATANVSVPILSYYHALNFFGRSANSSRLCRMAWEISKEWCRARRAICTDLVCWIRFTAFP